MDTSESVLGHYAAQQLQQRIGSPVLTIGRDVFTRAQLAKVSCFNYVACSRLQVALDDLRVKSVQDVFDRIPPMALAVPGVGVIALAVLGAAFQAKKVGGGSPLEAWVRRHHDGQTITFGALKERAHVADAPRAATAAKSARER